MKSIRLKARAKVNIALDVTERRSDGYHDVRMIMQTIDLFDKLTLKVQEQKGIHIETNLKYLPTDQRNLVYQIIETLIQKYDLDVGIEVDLYKMIPVAAGMAGGSTDAAAAIIGMNKLFDLGMSRDDMKVFAKDFGADIPYCIDGGTVLAEGIGDEMTVLPPFPDSYVVIAKPDFSVSTAFVYRNLVLDETTDHPQIDDVVTAIGAYRRDIIGALMSNVLEDVTVKEYPVISEIKNQLLEAGAYGALMSGSGPTVFGLFEDKHKASKAKHLMQRRKDIQFAYLTEIYNTH